MSPDFQTAAPQHPLEWTDCWLDLVCNVVRLAKQSQKELAKQLADLGLNETQFLVLWRIASSPDRDVAQSHLVDSLGLSKAQVSQHLEKLRSNGLILGVRASSDRRCQHWRCTRAGEEIIRQATARIGPDSGAAESLADGLRELSTKHGLLPTPEKLRIACAEERP